MLKSHFAKNKNEDLRFCGLFTKELEFRLLSPLSQVHPSQLILNLVYSVACSRCTAEKLLGFDSMVCVHNEWQICLNSDKL